MLWAVFGPARLLLPADLWADLSKPERATLLAHELAHLRRRDHWVRRLELLVLGLYWWLPVAWWARCRLQEAEEHCCDAWVVWALPGSGPAYAQALVNTLRFLSQARTVLPAGASGVGPVPPLKRRLAMILHGTTPRDFLNCGAQNSVQGRTLRTAPVGAGTPDSATPCASTDHRRRAPNCPRRRRPNEKVSTPRTLSRPSLWLVLGFGALVLPFLPLPGHGAPPPGPQTDPAGKGKLQKQSPEDAIHAAEIEKARAEVKLLKAQLDARRAQTRDLESRLQKAETNLAKLTGTGVLASPVVADGKLYAVPTFDVQYRTVFPVANLTPFTTNAFPVANLAQFANAYTVPPSLQPPKARTTEQRLADLEKKLREIAQEMQSLRRELKPQVPVGK